MFAQSKLLAIAIALVAIVRSLDAGETTQRFLVPITVALVPGAYGTLWTTELWYRNNSDNPVYIEPLAISDSPPIQQRTERLRIPMRPQSTPGLFLYVFGGPVDSQFDLRLYDRNDFQNSVGTKLPVVPDADFAPVANLINVPFVPAHRMTLRIYGLPTDSGTDTVHVRIYDLNEDPLTSVQLPFKAIFPGEPMYAQISSLADTFSQIPLYERVRVEIETAGGQTPVWGFITAISNDTQAVSIITPE